MNFAFEMEVTPGPIGENPYRMYFLLFQMRSINTDARSDPDLTIEWCCTEFDLVD